MPAGQLLKDIKTPPQVLELLNSIASVSLTPEDRAELERQYKLSCLYGGQEIAFIGTGDDLRILAFGTSEKVVRDLDSISLPADAIVKIEFPPRWKILRQIVAPPD
jgi:hypothetical protein